MRTKNITRESKANVLASGMDVTRETAKDKGVMHDLKVLWSCVHSYLKHKAMERMKEKCPKLYSWKMLNKSAPATLILGKMNVQGKI